LFDGRDLVRDLFYGKGGFSQGFVLRGEDLTRDLFYGRGG